MISTVTIRRESTAEVAIDHPDTWDDTQIAAAVANRAIDIAARADMWSGDNKTTVDGVEVGVDWRDSLTDSGAASYSPDAIALTPDDL